MNKAIAKGFTLVELMVAVGIMALLTGIVVTNLSSARAKARDSQRISDLSQIQLALTMFYDRCNQYPSGATLTVASTVSPVGTCAYKLGDFTTQVPVPPAGAGQTDYDYNVYMSASGKRVNYILHAKLEYSNAAVTKAMDFSSINDPDGSRGSWFQTICSTGSVLAGTCNSTTAGVPWNNCSNSATSIDYCVAPY